MRIIAAIALVGFVLLVAGFITHDDTMSGIGISTFIAGSLVASALSRRKRHPQRMAETTPGPASDKVSLTLALTEAAVRLMKRKKEP